MNQFTTKTNPLITPSASPPVSAPPQKRQRRASRSAPSPLSNLTSEPEFDLHGARQESSRRVLDVWSQLAERYTRRLDQDDIIDLKSVSIVKDRGFLRRSNHFALGCFAEGDDASVNDASSEGVVDPDDDFDELDAFAIEADISDEMEKQLSRNIQPVQEMNPADAEDLREFLEAEKKRKESCGDESDLSSDDFDNIDLETYDGPFDDDEGESEDPLGHENSDQSDGENGSEEEYQDRQKIMQELPIALLDEGSDDELGGWDVNEGNTVYQLPKESDGDPSELEFLTPSPAPTTRSCSNSTSPQRQSVSPQDRKSKSKSKSKVLSKRKSDTPLSLSPPRSQLQTPPQSSSSVTENTPDNFALAFSPPRPRPRPRPVYKGASNSKSPAPKSNVEVEAKYTKQRSNTASKSKVIQEVVRKPSREANAKVEGRRPGSARPEVADTLRRPLSDSVEKSPSFIQPKLSTEAKGKGKATAIERLPSSESDDPIILSSPPPSFTRESRSSRPPPDVIITSVPARANSSKRRKRKRVASSSLELSETDQQKEYAIPDVASSALTHKYLPVKNYDKGEAPRASSSTSLDAYETVDSLPQMISDAHRKHLQDEAFDIYSHAQPYTQQHESESHHQPPPSFAPFHDPRAQYIISQAVHQLSCLMAGNAPGHAPSQQPPYTEQRSTYQSSSYLPYQNPPWVPYTPGTHYHQPYPSSSPLSSGQPPSSASATPSHPHPYPHSVTPALSGGTLPPSSPESLSSPSRFPIESSTSNTRAKTLVRRSKSRGRRVSFRLEDEEFVIGDSYSEEPLIGEGSGRATNRFSEVGEVKQIDYTPAKRGRSKSRPVDEVGVNSSRGAATSEFRETSSGRERSKRDGRYKSPHLEHSSAQGSSGKGKGNAWTEERERSPTMSGIPHARRFVRAQTPGPPSRSVSPAGIRASRTRSVGRYGKPSASNVSRSGSS